jgi:hypothetical protein
MKCYSFPELNLINFSQLISSVLVQKSFANSTVNLLIILEYDFIKSSFFSLALYPRGSMILRNKSEFPDINSQNLWGLCYLIFLHRDVWELAQNRKHNNQG